MNRTKLLFVCSRNQWRSPTAEQLWHGHPAVDLRSAGTSASARRRVTGRDLAWADVIFVMERRHRAQLRAEFPEELDGQKVRVLDIPDEYPYMDPELVAELLRKVASELGLPEPGGPGA